MSGIDFDFPLNNALPPLPQQQNIIKVIGVGGGGGNAVRTMFEKGITGVDFYICNTDLQVLQGSPIPNKIQLGAKLTNGLGCGAKPEIGREAALESRDDIYHILSGNTKMVFVTAGMGGGTGTGAAPVIAEMAREMGILTIGIVTTPFRFEGDWRNRIARSGVAEMERVVDTLLVINNANLMEICPRNIKARDAYKMADKVLCDSAKGIAEIITTEGYMNVDFADVETVMKNSGSALMGMATHHGDNRAINAVEEALSSPLLDNVDIKGATGVLVNITASEDTLTMDEISVIGEYIHRAVGEEAKIISGQVLTDAAGDDLTVTIIATGFMKEHQPGLPEPRIEPRLEIVNRAVEQQPTYEEEFRPEPRIEVRQQPQQPAQQQRPAANKPAQRQQPQQPERRAAPSLFDTVEENPEPPVKPAPFYRQPEQQRPAQPQRNVHPERLDPSNPRDIEKMERVPSYLRRSVDIEQETNYEGPKKISRLTVNDEGEEGYRLRDNNSFLFDNVD